VLQVPLGVLLPTGLRLRVDQGSPVAIPFHHCRAEGCLALTPLRPELRRPLELGRKASLEFTTLDDRRLGVPVSLMGITDGLRALDQSARGGGGATRE
jgi:invasion protein IalB